MNNFFCMCTYNNTVPESPSPSTSEVETTAISSITSLFQFDSVYDQSTDSLPPSPKQPRIEQGPEVSLVYIYVAYWAKRRSSLAEHEKYNFNCYHFTPDNDYSLLSTSVFEKVQLVDLIAKRMVGTVFLVCPLLGA